MIFLGGLCKLSPESVLQMRQLIFFVLFTHFSSAFAQHPVLEQRLADYLSQLPSSVNLNYRIESLDGNLYASRSPDERVPSASIIKIPILVEVMEQVKAQHFELTDYYTLQNTDKVGGAGTISQQAEGKAYTYEELARQMMISSDNTATNVLIRKVGREAVNGRMKLMGFSNLQLNRVMMDTAAVARGIENYVNATDINRLLSLIYQRKVATPALCDLMVAFLLDNHDTTTLPSLIPPQIGIAHKTGTLTYIRGDAGIIFTQKPFAISVFVRGVPQTQAERIIGEVGKICYEVLK